MLVTPYEMAANELGISDKYKAWKYIYVDVEKLNDFHDRKKLEWAFEVVQVMNVTGWYNKLQADLGLNKSVDFSIGEEAISAILTETSFTDEQLQRFFTWEKELETVYKVLEKFLPEDYYMPYQVEYLLLGLPFKDIIEGTEDLSEPYGNLSINYLTGRSNTDLESFIRQAKELVLDYTIVNITEEETRPI